MRQVTCCLLILSVALVAWVDAQDYQNIDPVQQASDDTFGANVENHGERTKRKYFEPIVQASFGIKSTLLNLIFGKVNQLIDYKTRLVKDWDKKNVELNKQYGLYGNKQPCDNPSTTALAYPPLYS